MNYISTVPHQNIVEILPDDRHGDRPYAVLTERERIIATKLLNDGTASFILYTFFAANKEGFRFALSPAAIFNECGITKKQYRTACNRLEEEGYLVRKAPKSNILLFWRVPQKYQDLELSQIQSVRSLRKKGKVQMVEESDESICVPLEDAVAVPDGAETFGEVRQDAPSALQGTVEFPQEEHGVAPEGTEIIYYSNNIINNIDDITGNSYCPKGNKNENVERIISEIWDEFGHLDILFGKLAGIKQTLERKNLSEHEYIRMLENLKARLQNDREAGISHARSSYRTLLDKTHPKNAAGIMKRMKALALYAEHRGLSRKQIHKIMEQKNIWIDEWNEALGEHELIFAPTWLPPEVVAKMHDAV